MRQAIIADIHEWYRADGVNWNWASENLDAIGIRACQGMNMDELFPEHVERADSHGLNYFTYAVLTHLAPPDEAVDYYLELDGVSGHPVCGDVEPADGGMITEYHGRRFFQLCDLKSNSETWYYSNYNSSKKIGFPKWSKDRFCFWAEYPYDIVTKYRSIDRYLQKNPWKIPKWAARTGYTPDIHQFTDYGKAQGTIANQYTSHPVYKHGIKGADFSVSLMDADELKLLFNHHIEKPSVLQRIELLESQVSVLGRFHGIE